MKFQLLPYFFITPVLLFVVGAQFNECSINDENCTSDGRDVELYMDLLWKLENGINNTLKLPDYSWGLLKVYNGNLSINFEDPDDCACLLHELKDKVYVTYNIASFDLGLLYSLELATDKSKLQGSVAIFTEILDMKIHLIDYRDGGYKIKDVIIEEQNVFSYYSYGAFSDSLEDMPVEVYNVLMQGPLKKVMEKALLNAFSQQLKELYHRRNRTSNNLI